MTVNYMKYMSLVTLAAVAIALSNVVPAAANWGKDDKHIDHLKKELLLSDAQASQIKAICDETMEQKEALHKVKKERINAVLTPEQKDKYDRMKKDWKNKD